MNTLLTTITTNRDEIDFMRNAAGDIEIIKVDRTGKVTGQIGHTGSPSASPIIATIKREEAKRISEFFAQLS